jgi:hypothetical protein
VQHAVPIVKRRRAGLTYKAIAEELGLTKYHMENCAKVSRWCSKHWLPADAHPKYRKRRRKAS